jgi:hypothetical protein
MRAAFKLTQRPHWLRFNIHVGSTSKKALRLSRLRPLLSCGSKASAVLGELKMYRHAIAALALALGALVTGTAVASDPDTVATGQQASPSKKDTSKRVCRTIVPSGTRMGTRSCRTQAEWDASADKAARFLERGQQEGSRRDGEFNTSR